MKKLFIAIVVAMLLPLFAAAPANATAGCVTPREFFREIAAGDTKRFVEARFDTRGYVYDRYYWDDGTQDLYKYYDTCRYADTDYVDVNYDDYSFDARGLRLYSGTWWHTCRDYEYFGNGEYYCYDNWFQGYYYDDGGFERRSSESGEKTKGFKVVVTN